MIFLFPTYMESARFVAACPEARVEICGVGMAATAAAVAQLSRELVDREVVVLAGIAGSYDVSNVAICEVVEVCSEQIEELPQRFRVAYENPSRFALRGVSSNTVSRSNFRGAASQIENMEGAAFFAVCLRLGIAYSEVRAISNVVGDDVANWSIDEACEALTHTLIDIYRE